VIVHHRTATVRGRTVAYREAGDPAAPAVALLHGFPTSSFMFRGLIEDLADRYRVIAPDHIGFGASEAPPRSEFAYTFDSLATVTAELLEQLGVSRYGIYLQDYGSPVGLRIASRHPERVSALVVQNGNAYEDGLTSFWDGLRAYWRDPAAHADEVRSGLTLDHVRWQYTHGVPAERLDLVSPDTWTLDTALLARPGIDAAQLELMYDYRTNVEAYPAFHAYFREHRPPTLIVWGRNDEIFGVDGARAYLRDLPDAELHLLDTGHFALETHRAEIAALIHDFLPRAFAGRPAAA
jgi:pimeloyl-ACP methyl ester carboxylesterase